VGRSLQVASHTSSVSGTNAQDLPLFSYTSTAPGSSLVGDPVGQSIRSRSPSCLFTLAHLLVAYWTRLGAGQASKQLAPIKCSPRAWWSVQWRASVDGQ